MNITPTYKAWLALALVASMSILMALHTITTDAGMPIIGLIVGIVIGNGRTAAAGSIPSPVVTSPSVQQAVNDANAHPAQ